jgi:hypothetical protein
MYRVVTMGGLGDAASDAAQVAAGSGQGLDPLQKQQFLLLAPQIPDAKAEDLADIVDATPYGHRQKLLRYGLGAVIGGVVTVLVVMPAIGLVVTHAFGKKGRR